MPRRSIEQGQRIRAARNAAASLLLETATGGLMANVLRCAVLAAALGITVLASPPLEAKVEGDTIVLGESISLTGKYSSNGINSKNGYDFAVARINELGGVKVGGNRYKLKIQYYDDESTPARAAQLAER